MRKDVRFLALTLLVAVVLSACGSGSESALRPTLVEPSEVVTTSSEAQAPSTIEPTTETVTPTVVEPPVLREGERTAVEPSQQPETTTTTSTAATTTTTTARSANEELNLTPGTTSTTTSAPFATTTETTTIPPDQIPTEEEIRNHDQVIESLVSINTDDSIATATRHSATGPRYSTGVGMTVCGALSGHEKLVEMESLITEFEEVFEFTPDAFDNPRFAARTFIIELANVHCPEEIIRLEQASEIEPATEEQTRGQQRVVGRLLATDVPDAVSIGLEYSTLNPVTADSVAQFVCEQLSALDDGNQAFSVGLDLRNTFELDSADYDNVADATDALTFAVASVHCPDEVTRLGLPDPALTTIS